jgi:formyltetrahydrofolate deformylase
MSSSRRYTLSLSCPDRVGIVAAVSGFLAQNQGWITEANNHADAEAGRFFMRQEILADSLPFGIEALRDKFAPIAIPCVISNHETFRGFVEWHGIPFHHVPVTPENKPAAYAKVADLFREAEGDVMVLARYMQILSPELCENYPGQIINIHHSFLPSFVGAKPYHQAYTRGVKLIGATCHYVTSELDQGPIIEQDVIRVDHSDAPDDLVRYGKDIEKAVLARGLRYHLEDRVLVHGNKTVVFR